MKVVRRALSGANLSQEVAARVVACPELRARYSRLRSLEYRLSVIQASRCKSCIKRLYNATLRQGVRQFLDCLPPGERTIVLRRANN